ncbi:TPA: hypothetical protein QDC27_003252 [Burkholderia cepacia ATCC 25416]|nr:hypothetical protein [Burkholderia cepacia ATCC 25416]HDR9775456.1 hypothetical protein [Burkholderia cepacia ATCC 25416]HDR9784058.1 hypothetical protein [Burkholderia cepacia ATCC 25416]HDR9791875.1 hypothetical protein [Burkholderia cepacia ATCC 25416]
MNTRVFWRSVMAAFAVMAGSGPLLLPIASTARPGKYIATGLCLTLIVLGSFELGRVLEGIPKSPPENSDADTPAAPPIETGEKPTSSSREWAEAELLELLAEYEKGGVTQDALGDRYGITGRRVGQLIARAREVRGTSTTSLAAKWPPTAKPR